MRTGTVIDDKLYRKQKNKEQWLRVCHLDSIRLIKEDMIAGKKIYHLEE